MTARRSGWSAIFTATALRFVGEVPEMPAPQPPAAPVAGDKPAIAVLPFDNLTGEPEQEYFVDGIVEETTTAIVHFPRLFVIACNSSFAYKSRAVGLKQVARERGALCARVLGPQIRQPDADRRAIDRYGDRRAYWAERFDGAVDDVFALQDEVASGVAGAIEPNCAWPKSPALGISRPIAATPTTSTCGPSPKPTS